MLRKFFNKPTPDQAKIIDSELEALKELARKESQEQYKKEQDSEKRVNGRCPLCSQTTIVNKISRVKGSGSVSGSFSLGYGSIYGSSETDTNEVNHCSGCGNEWKKYEMRYQSTSEVLGYWINDIWSYYGEKRTIQFDFIKARMQILKKFHAETIFKTFKEVDHACYYSTKDNISLSFLRKHFKSVYE